MSALKSRQYHFALRAAAFEQRVDFAQVLGVDGRLVRLLRDWRTESYPLHALLPSGRFLPHRVKALVDFLAAKFEAVTVELATASG